MTSNILPKRILILGFITLALASCNTGFKDDGLTYVDMSAFPLYGKVITDTDELYRRCPVSIEERLPDREAPEMIKDLCRCSAGLYIRFRSNTTEMKARWEVAFKDKWYFAHMTDVNKRGLDVYTLLDGQWVHFGCAKPQESKVSEATIQEGLDGSMREYMLYLSNYDQVKWIKIGITEGAVIENPVEITPSNEKPIIYYGTSCTQGACPSRPGMSYTNILSRLLDRTVINLGMSGNGCLDYPMAEYMAMSEDPGCFVLDNVGNCFAPEIEERTAPFIRILREKHPDVPILMLNDNHGDMKTVFDSAYVKRYTDSHASEKAVFDSLIASGEKELYYWDKNYPEMMPGFNETVDRHHFTDSGMKIYAEYVAAQIRAILK